MQQISIELPITAYHCDVQLFFRDIFQTRSFISQETTFPVETLVKPVDVSWTHIYIPPPSGTMKGEWGWLHDTRLQSSEWWFHGRDDHETGRKETLNREWIDSPQAKVGDTRNIFSVRARTQWGCCLGFNSVTFGPGWAQGRQTEYALIEYTKWKMCKCQQVKGWKEAVLLGTALWGQFREKQIWGSKILSWFEWNTYLKSQALSLQW